MVYIFASALPRIEDDKENFREEGILEKLGKRIPLDKIDDGLIGLWQKFLRRLKVLLLKLDNLTTHWLTRSGQYKTKSQNLKKENNGNGLTDLKI